MLIPTPDRDFRPAARYTELSSARQRQIIQLNPAEYLKIRFEQLPYAENADQPKQLLSPNLKDITLN